MNRRAFLASTLTLSLARSTMAQPQTRKANVKNRNKADLPTPALLLDLDAFEANLRTMADHCKRAA